MLPPRMRLIHDVGGREASVVVASAAVVARRRRTRRRGMVGAVCVSMVRKYVEGDCAASWVRAAREWE